ncbi:uncharacterized protein LOC101847073 [Aplysia californica]|uniref:Uncharacterized protein LOC101847073 n=1 Tax=Aplysia californica TaxID=6500 RepID=A0ABM0K842_APLCA|nr:uncharacterized protein LOC101847073 [Aplysia californica]
MKAVFLAVVAVLCLPVAATGTCLDRGSPCCSGGSHWSEQKRGVKENSIVNIDMMNRTTKLSNGVNLVWNATGSSFVKIWCTFSSKNSPFDLNVIYLDLGNNGSNCGSLNTSNSYIPSQEANGYLANSSKYSLISKQRLASLNVTLSTGFVWLQLTVNSTANVSVLCREPEERSVPTSRPQGPMETGEDNGHSQDKLKTILITVCCCVGVSAIVCSALVLAFCRWSPLYKFWRTADGRQPVPLGSPSNTTAELTSTSDGLACGDSQNAYTLPADECPLTSNSETGIRFMKLVKAEEKHNIYTDADQPDRTLDSFPGVTSSNNGRGLYSEVDGPNNRHDAYSKVYGPNYGFGLYSEVDRPCNRPGLYSKENKSENRQDNYSFLNKPDSSEEPMSSIYNSSQTAEYSHLGRPSDEPTVISNVYDG